MAAGLESEKLVIKTFYQGIMHLHIDNFDKRLSLTLIAK